MDNFGFHMCYRIFVRTEDGHAYCKRVDDLYEAGVREFLVPCTDGVWHKATLSRIPFPEGQKVHYLAMYGTKGIVGTGNMPCCTRKGIVPIAALKRRKDRVLVNTHAVKLGTERHDTDSALGCLIGAMLPGGAIEGDCLSIRTAGQASDAVNIIRNALSAINENTGIDQWHEYTHTKLAVRSPELVEAVGHYLKGDHNEIFELTDAAVLSSAVFRWSLLLGLKSMVVPPYQSIRVPSIEAAYMALSLAAIDGRDFVWNQEDQKPSSRKGHENEQYSAALIRFDDGAHLAFESDLRLEGRYVNIEDNVEVSGLHEVVYSVAVEGGASFITPTGVIACSAPEVCHA